MSTCRASCADAPRAEPETARQHVGFEDRLEHDLHRRLHDPVTHRRDRQRPLFALPGLGMNTRRAGSGRYLPSFRSIGQLVKQPGHPVLARRRQ